MEKIYKELDEVVSENVNKAAQYRKSKDSDFLSSVIKYTPKFQVQKQLLKDVQKEKEEEEKSRKKEEQEIQDDAAQKTLDILVDEFNNISEQDIMNYRKSDTFFVWKQNDTGDYYFVPDSKMVPPIELILT